MSSRPPTGLQPLESRCLMSAVHLTTYINSTYFIADSTTQQNGAVSDYNGNAQLPNGSDSAATVFHNVRLPISRFSTSVTVGPPNSISQPQYFDFIIQAGSPTALGDSGASAGYAGGTMSDHSVAVVVDYNNGAPRIGFASKGQVPTDFVPITGYDPSASFGLLTMNVNYREGRLNVSLGSFGIQEIIDLPAVIGDQTAYVGFGGSTGASPDGFQATLAREWVYRGIEAPNFDAPAAGVIEAGGKTAALSANVSAADSGPVTYTWRSLSKPAGAATPLLADPNDDDTRATFSKPGTYRFQLTATDAQGLSTSQNVSVRVAALTKLRIDQHKLKVARGTSQQFHAYLYDQFGREVNDPDGIRYSITQGTGTIDALSGLFTAGRRTGHLEITASGGGLSGVSGNTIV